MATKHSPNLPPTATAAEGGNPKVQKFKASDYRLHGGADSAERHWLLQHPYGRELLITRLGRLLPQVPVNRFCTAPEHESLMDAMIDELGLRKWPRPETIGERVRASLMLLRFGFAMGGFKSPDWRSLYDVRGRSA